MIDKAKAKLSEEETRRLKDTIEEVKDGDRVPKEEEEVINNLKQEFKKLKIENNREKKEENVRYGERQSCFDNWKSFKNSQGFKNFRKSESRPGFYRNKNGDTYKTEIIHQEEETFQETTIVNHLETEIIHQQEITVKNQN